MACGDDAPPEDGGVDAADGGDADVGEDAADARDAGEDADATVPPGTWTETGPYLGGIYSVAVDPFDAATLFVGATGWVWRSRDRGDSWAKRPWPEVAAPGSHLPDAWWLAPSRAEEGLIYAASLFQDVYVSTDRGDSWTYCDCGTASCRLPQGLGQFSQVVAHPTAGGTVYVGVAWDCTWVRNPSPGATPLCVGQGGVFRSDDYCEHFTAVNGSGTGALDNTRIDALALDPSDPDVLYAGTMDGIFRTDDGGGSWALDYAMASGEVIVFSSIEVGADGAAYAAVLFAAGQDAWVLRRDPTSGTWSAADTGLRNEPQIDSTLGIPVRAWRLDVNDADPDVVHIATQGYGVLQSLDGAASWESLSLPGEAGDRFYAVATAPGAADELYAGPVGGALQQSDDGGETWRRTWWTSYPAGFAFSPAAPGHAFAALYGGGGVAESSDGGRSWVTPISGLTHADVGVIAVDPADALVRYVGMPLTGAKVYRTEDGGETWTDRSIGLDTTPWSKPVVGLVVNAAAPMRLYVAQRESNLYRSTDGADSWAPWAEGLPYPDAVATLAIASGDPATLYAGSFALTFEAQVFERSEAEAAWAPAGGRLDACSAIDGCSVTGLARDGATGVLYAATNEAGLFRLPPGASEWEPVGVGLTTGFLTGVTVHADRTGWVAVGSLEAVDPEAAGSQGVFLSRDGGESFVALSAGLTNRGVLVTAFVPGEDALLAGTFGGGVFRADLEP